MTTRISRMILQTKWALALASLVLVWNVAEAFHLDNDALQNATQSQFAPVGLFIGGIEEGARIFTPVRLLPFEHPEADNHEFPNALQLHESEYEALVWLGQQVGLQLAATLQRYPRRPVERWWYDEFEPIPLDRIKEAPVSRIARTNSPIPGFKAAVYYEGQVICFIVDTRGLTLEERGMDRPSTMGLDLTRAKFLAAFADLRGSLADVLVTVAILDT